MSFNAPPEKEVLKFHLHYHLITLFNLLYHLVFLMLYQVHLQLKLVLQALHFFYDVFLSLCLSFSLDHQDLLIVV